MPETPRLSVPARADLDADLLVVACCQGEAADASGLPPPLAAAIERLASRPGWEGRDKQRLDGEPAGGGPLVSLRGLGKAEELTARRLADWLARTVEAAEIDGCRRLALLLPDHPQVVGDGAPGRVERTALLSGYRFDRYRSNGHAPAARVGELALLPPAAGVADYRQAAPEATAVAGGAVLCRDLANSPANEATPDWMEARARELAAGLGMTIAVLKEDELRRRGMGGLLAVGGGSPHRPRLLRLEWGSAGPTVALVGKGVTFDTGGISIKPAADMDEMKYDKCGACTALGIARAVVELRLPLRLRVYLPLAENMPDGASYRPGDIVRCYNGKTVEILNTDAEGRMILADALAWAAEAEARRAARVLHLDRRLRGGAGAPRRRRLHPDDELAGELLAAAERSGERLWRLPLWPEFVEQMRGTHADLRNSAGAGAPPTPPPPSSRSSLAR